MIEPVRIQSRSFNELRLQDRFWSTKSIFAAIQYMKQKILHQGSKKLKI